MDPKLKALELVSEYEKITRPLFKLNEYVIEKEYNKQCALFSVDKIIESRKDDGAFDDTKWGNSSEYYTPHPMYLNYWNLVKIEINKL